MDQISDITTITRIEIIDEKGRQFVSQNRKNVRLSIQDDGRTLKIFCESLKP